MELIKRSWWILALQGIFLVGLGLLAILMPDLYLDDVVQYLGLILLAFGFIITAWAWRTRSKARYWLLMFFIGLSQFALGLAILVYPNDSSRVFATVIGGWAFLMGLFQVIIGVLSKNNRILYLVNALISMVFGGLIIYDPFESEKALTYLVGFYSILLGIMVVYYSFRLRGWSQRKIDKGEPNDQEVKEATT